MYLDEGGTYLEEFLGALEFVPIDVRRNFDLVSKFFVLYQSKLILFR